MDFAPVPDECENQQHRGDQKQAGSFGGIDCMPVMLVRGSWFGFWR